MTTNPTTLTYTHLRDAYDFFNAELFDNKLPPCLVTLQRHRGTYGYFCYERFKEFGAENKTDEIALNPAHFDRGAERVLSTLVHEMVHLAIPFGLGLIALPLFLGLLDEVRVLKIQKGLLASK